MGGSARTHLPVLLHRGLPAGEGVLVDLLLHLLGAVCDKDGAGGVARAHLACLPLRHAREFLVAGLSSTRGVQGRLIQWWTCSAGKKRDRMRAGLKQPNLGATSRVILK